MRSFSLGSRSSFRKNSGELDDMARTSSSGGGAMLPLFFSDLAAAGPQELVELTLEIDNGDSLLVMGGNAEDHDDSTPQSDSMKAALFGRSGSKRVAERVRCVSHEFVTELRRFARARSLSGRSVTTEEAPVTDARAARRVQARLERTRSGAKEALKGLRFISKTATAGGGDSGEMWPQVAARFDKLAKDDLLCRHDFAACIGMDDSKEFAGGVFDALARRRHQKIEKITKEELYDFWLQISDQSFDARLQIFFDMVDTNADGKITREEVQELIILSASANKLSKLKEQAQEYATLIMEELDPENLGYIELWQLEALLLQRDNYMNYSRPLSTTSQAWSQNIGFKSKNLVRRISSSIGYFWQENWQRVWILSIWMLIMAGLFAWKFMQYKKKAAFEVVGYCLLTAKGAAETLKLNMALVLLPVCRNTLTWLRSTRARLFIPFDDNINFHKMIAIAIVMGILLHAGNHIACDFPRLVHASPSQFDLIASDFNREMPTYKSLFGGVAGITGIAMVVLMAIAFTLATRYFRKNAVKIPPPINRLTGFNAFWYSHHLLAIVYLLLIVHSNYMYFVHKWYEKTTWMYLSVPLILYLGERTLRTLRSKSFAVKILKVAVVPGRVLTLVMSKPQGFRYKSGQYIFLQCPAVSPFEWHPFSITSAPDDSYLSVHIRTIGDWTEELKRVFAETCDSSSVIGRAKFDDQGRIDQKSLPRLLVDGPYGAPAQDYRNYDVLLLVGLGIGATPFISILRDLLNNIKLSEDQTDTNTDFSRSDDSSNSFISMASSKKKQPQRTTHAHFYWVTREASSFEWFKGVMDEVAEMDQKGIIEMHNYLTCVYEEGDARSTLLTMVQALNHAKHGVDIVSGTRVRTHFARPDWRKVFTKIASKHPYKTVGVFYCGMPVLAKELKRMSHELSHNSATRFQFHKENF
ncbi:hypothetical protein AMTRI_Chr12g234330 [Amborella trichopoda]